MKKMKVLALCAIAAGIVVSCQKNDANEEIQPEVSTKISEEHQLALEDAGVNPLHAVYKNMEFIDGTVERGILAGSLALQDIFIPLSDLQNQKLGVADEGSAKQYRTNNLVNTNRTFTIIGYTGSTFGLSSTAQTALRWAVNNYNRLDTNLRFQLSFGTDFQDKDIVVYDNTVNNPGVTGGVAGFPTGGRPFNRVQIYGVSGSNTNSIEHLITHEIGHCVGFRHTDYARRRCDNINEGSGGSLGAINVPGTPTENRWGRSGLDSDSIMISCYGSGVDGEFSNFDIVALEFMY